MSIKKAQQLVQVFIVTLIFVIGVVTALTVTDAGKSAPSREPASFAAGIEPKALPKEIEVVQLNCEHQSYQVSHASQIRLSGKVCGAGASAVRSAPKRSRIKNISTNSEAMVFLLEKANHFTTDLIPVQAGKNSIEILNDYEDGRTDTKLIDVLIQ